MRSREQDTQYRRQLRARKRAEAEANTDATILQMPARPGDVETAVKAELASLTATTDYEGLAQAALVLARTLDNPAAGIHHAATARTLNDLLVRLHRASTGRNGGKLMTMREARRRE